MTVENIDRLVETKVAWFKTKGHGIMTSMMMKECKIQFIEMAQGGTGECTHQGNIREEYYKSFPDSFFQRVCDEMGWPWK
tara:strand:- start:299 stop:538 length:240 start_codon:yes stop_codon:yes gene_type:complete